MTRPANVGSSVTIIASPRPYTAAIEFHHEHIPHTTRYALVTAWCGNHGTSHTGRVSSYINVAGSVGGAGIRHIICRASIIGGPGTNARAAEFHKEGIPGA